MDDDERARRQQEYREQGQRLVITQAAEPRYDDVRIEGGPPIRGITQVTIEDNVESGRAVILRLRDFELRFPDNVQPPDTTTKGEPDGSVEEG